MKTLTELRAGIKDYSTLGTITSILKNTNYTKNAVVYGDEMYFGMKNDKGALNLSRKLGKTFGDGDEISGLGGGPIRSNDSAIAAILGKDVVAYVSIEFNEAPAAKFISAAKAKVMTDSEYRKNHREIVGK
jgi:hypothetical protein